MCKHFQCCKNAQLCFKNIKPVHLSFDITIFNCVHKTIHLAQQYLHVVFHYAINIKKKTTYKKHIQLDCSFVIKNESNLLNIVKQSGLNEARGDVIRYVLAGMRVGVCMNAGQTDWCM